MESDLIYDNDVIKSLVESKEKNLAVVAKYKDWMDGTVVKCDENKNITSFIGKNEFNLDELNQYYKTVNIYKFSKEFFADYYMPFLKLYMDIYGKNDYYETVLKVTTIFKGIKLKAHVLTDQLWYEIDNEEDLKNASKLFEK